MGISYCQYGVSLDVQVMRFRAEERCKTTINGAGENEVLNVLGGDAETNALRAKRRCQKCGTAMDSYLIDRSVNCMCVVITRPVTATRLKKASSASKGMTARR